MNSITLENIHNPIRYKRDIVPKYMVGYAINGQMIFWQEDSDLLIQYDHAPDERRKVAGFRRIIRPILPPYYQFTVMIAGDGGSRRWVAEWYSDKNTSHIGEDEDIFQAILKTGYTSDERVVKLLLKQLDINY